MYQLEPTSYLWIAVTAACLLLGQATARADTIPEIVAKAKPAVDAEIYFDRGMDSLSLLHYDKAISDYSEAIRVNPNYANAYCGRGIAYYEVKNYDKAVSDYSEAIRLDPNLANAYYGRGIAYLQTGNRAEANADFATAERINGGR
jgi:tetratricopeptide (TPR) repeat protein